MKEDEDPKGNHHRPSQREEPQLHSQSILALFTVADERRDTPRAAMERKAKNKKGRHVRKVQQVEFLGLAPLSVSCATLRRSGVLSGLQLLPP